jgi:hypothetical protein
MRQLHTVALAALIGVSGLGCATAPPGAAHDPAQPVADAGCRDVTSLEGKVQTYCGTPEQWARFDSQMAALGQGFSCKPVKGARPLCLFARQWDYVSQVNAMRTGLAPSNFFEGSKSSAMAIERNEYPAVRQALIDSNNGRPVLLP